MTGYTSLELLAVGSSVTPLPPLGHTKVILKGSSRAETYVPFTS